jgi:dihydroxyacetone kinase
LIDALAPCADAWEACATKGNGFKTAFQAGAAAAASGAEKTKSMVAHLGRAGTVGARSLGFPDAGAYGVGVIFNLNSIKIIVYS